MPMDARIHEWGSDEISVLRALLRTPRRSSGGAGAAQDEFVWDSSGSEATISPKRTAADERAGEEAPSKRPCRRHSKQEEEEEASEDEQDKDDDDAERSDPLVVTALRRQVQLLQQEFNRYLEQRVARSVVAAGGRSAPCATKIRLSRQYEQLARWTESLQAENRQLEALLQARQQQQQQLSQTSLLPLDGTAPFQVATASPVDTGSAAAAAQWPEPLRSVRRATAEAKEPSPHRTEEREAMP